MRKIITTLFLMLAVTLASAQTSKTEVKDSIATNSGSSTNIKRAIPVKSKKLSKKERKELAKKSYQVSLGVPDCFGGHDSASYAKKDSFDTLRPLCKDSVKQ